jgi:hypothetical protein
MMWVSAAQLVRSKPCFRFAQTAWHGLRPCTPAALPSVRVSAEEYAALRAKAEQMGMTPAQWLREAALSRRLPSPPVPPINREQYAELARLAANLNQLTRLANEGRPVTVADALLQRLAGEVGRLRLALIGAGGGE